MPTLTDTRLQTAIEYIRSGVPKKYAAAAAGIHRDTLHEWESSNPDISDLVAHARAEFLAKKVVPALTKCVEPDFTGDPKLALDAAKFLAERQFRDIYGPSLDLRTVPTETLAELLGGTEQEAPLSIQERKRRAIIATSDAQTPIEVP